ncbi:MAG: hypothetical protein ACLR0U_14175 [Enterocloster clostridioformis]
MEKIEYAFFDFKGGEIYDPLTKEEERVAWGSGTAGSFRWNLWPGRRRM